MLSLIFRKSIELVSKKNKSSNKLRILIIQNNRPIKTRAADPSLWSAIQDLQLDQTLCVILTTSFTFSLVEFFKNQMETKEVVHPEETLDSMIPEETSKSQKYDTYCPDFSDIRDDSYGFWDFLSNKRDVSKNIKEKSDEDNQHKNKFWDFLGPSVDEKFQNIAELKDYKKTDTIVSSPEDSGIYLNEIIEDQRTQIYPEIRNISNPIAGFAENCSNMPELKSSGSDDEFWDFLHCNSPVLNFQEVIQNYVSADKDTKNSSRFEAGEESPFISDSDYVESGRCSTISSTPSYFPSNTNIYASFNGNCENNTPLMDIKQSSNIKSRNVFDSNIDFTSYDAVLSYLQDTHTINKEVECSNTKNTGITMLNKEHKSICGGKAPEQIDDESWNSSFSAILAQLNEIPVTESEEPQNLLHSTANKLNTVEEKTHGRVDLPSNTFPQNIESSVPLFRNVNQKSNSNDGLPCITSVFSINPCSAILEKKRPIVIDPSKANIQKSEKIHHALNKKHYRRVRSNFSKRLNQNESLHVNKINNAVNTNSNSNTTTLGFSNPEIPRMQNQLPNLMALSHPLQRGNTNINVKTNSGNSNVNSVVTQSSTPSVPVVAKNATNSAPLYLILPPNSTSLQNPNYSHFFVILNNNAQPHQSTSVQNSEVVSNLSNVKNITSQTTTCFSENHSVKINKSDVLIKNGLQLNTSNISVPILVDNSKTQNIKYSLIPQLGTVHNPQASTIQRSTDQTSIQALKLSSNVNNFPNSLKSMAVTSSSSNVSNANLNLFTSSSSADPNSSKIESLSNSKIDSKFQLPQSKAKQVLSKPIKNISLGKDKYAIQQISIPMKIGSIDNENDILYPQESNTDLSPTNERALCGNKTPENNSKQSLVPNSAGLTMNNISNSINSNVENLNLNALKQITTNLNTNSIPKSVTTELNLKSSAILNLISTNSKGTNQNSATTNTHSIHFNVVPVSEALQINRNTSITNTNKLVQSNNTPNTLINNLDSSNNYVQIKVAPSQNTSLSTLKELFPPPISMVPVCIMAPIHNAGQATTSKVVILKGPAQQQVIPQKMQLNHIDSRQRSFSKKQNMKFKKSGPKTVRQLLQERRRQNLSKLLCDKNKERKEVKVLKPILRLPVSASISSTTKTVPTSTINAASNSGCVTSTNSNKRPNILLLPSSLKPAKKMVTSKERLNILTQEPEFADDYSVFENPEETLCPFLSSSLNRKDCRPRHYDMSDLQIGFFKVSDDIDSCGRFRSKFKVIFSKRQFLYDFPVSRCNQMCLKSTHIWEQMARITVPFKTIVSMKLRERVIQININSPPLICLGSLQARSGIIANATVYDTTIENDSSWGNIIRSSFHHKIILRKRQANKLRSFLCHFDDRFITLTSLGICETGYGNANEVSVFEGELSPNSLKKQFFKKGSTVFLFKLMVDVVLIINSQFIVMIQLFQYNTCNKCYVVSPKFPYCPTCRDKTSTSTNSEFDPKEYRFDMKENNEDKRTTTKSGQKPEIILLDTYSISKKSISEDREEMLIYQDSVDCLIDVEE
ncbi:CXC domain-containing protein [Trichonephila inaurata madagascariensis]|uniref:CXC domain-containing protein n=1 Tax=Trichonephila inaurata madagascariensis TaxID=2747483 RepID=A0A8X6YUD0_9ARAC|nr:CXC domain-containing protein [Trichonephila inaurata madagascariensis]